MANIALVKSAFLTADNKGIVPPMGLMYCAAYLRSKSRKHTISLLDLRLYQGRETQALTSFLRESAPDYIGISAITMEAGSMLRIARLAKALYPDVPVIVGGPHPTAYLRETLSEPSIDLIVRGEGEETFAELIEALEEKRDLSQVNGIAFRDEDGQIKQTTLRKAIENLDDLPYPAWDILEIERYFQKKSMSILGHRRYMTLFTSRACPYRCNYCHNMFGKRFRACSPEHVLSEITLLKKRYGITHYEIIDDIFNLDYDRALRIFEGLAESNLRCHFAFPNGVRSDLLDKQMLSIWRRGGTVNISFAIETASPRLQKLIRKNLKIEKAKSAIAEAAKLGILCNGFFMIGFPTESKAEVKQTIQFALHSKLHTALFFIVTPFQGTDLVKDWGDRVDLSATSFEDYDYFRGNYNMSNLPTRELYKLQRSAFRRFYLNPVRVARIYANHPSKRNLLNLGWMAFRKFLFSTRGNLSEKSIAPSQTAKYA